jgi:tetratricopeptide (TPR) repeat protein
MKINPFFEEKIISEYKRPDPPSTPNVNTGPSAFEYVQGKKWSLEKFPCSLNGGAYFVYSKESGLIFTAGGKSTMPEDSPPRKFEYHDEGPSKFSYKEITYGNDFAKRSLGTDDVITQEIQAEIVLLDSQTIKETSKITLINFDKMLKGIKEYNPLKVQESERHICSLVKQNQANKIESKLSEGAPREYAISNSRAPLVDSLPSEIQAQNKAARSSQFMVEECDKLAGSPMDPQKTVTGVSYDKLDATVAIPTCKQATEVDPNNARLWFQLGRAYEKQGNNDQAISAYQKAAQLGSAAAYNNIGELYRQGKGFSKNKDKAAEYFQKSAQMGSDEGKDNLAKLTSRN